MLYIRRIFHQDVTHQMTANKEGSIYFFKYDYSKSPKDREITFVYLDKNYKPEYNNNEVLGILHPDDSESRINGGFKSFLFSNLEAKESDFILIWNTKDLSKYYFSFVNRGNALYSLLEKLVGKDNHFIVLEQSEDKRTSIQEPLQQIYYGAPGTGKSYKINETTEAQPKENVFRTTFHPDTDYASFVGCYKPITHKKDMLSGKGFSEPQLLSEFFDSKDKNKYHYATKARYLYESLIHTQDIRELGLDASSIAEKLKQNGFDTCAYVTEANCMYNIYDWLKEDGYIVKNGISYEFVPQVFVKAYCRAYETDKPVYLVIEEINRGNCAQIFGDIFQLLDREDDGYSSYAVKPDADLEDYLVGRLGDKYDKEGGMKLPPNLYIWATMNTSDQSLFPIDSAFKRRWDWKYMPINTEKENWTIQTSAGSYSWSSFLKIINEEIYDTTSSEDKQLGFYFCKANKGVISAEKFVSKVLFYLYNDVFKDYGLEQDFFKDKDNENKIMSFQSFYNKVTGQIVESQVVKILDNLGVEEADDVVYENEDDATDDGNNKGDYRRLLHVEFPDETIIIKRFKQYFEVLKKIGLDKAETVASEKEVTVLGCAMVTKEPEETIEKSNPYYYKKEGEFYVVGGMKGNIMQQFIPLISKRYNLNLKVYYK